MYDVAKENVLISCAVTAQLVCVFVFAYVISYEACHENQSMPWVQNKMLLISMHIHAFGSAPFLFAQTVITLTELYNRIRWLEAWHLRDCTIDVTKNKGADQLRLPRS